MTATTMDTPPRPLTATPPAAITTGPSTLAIAGPADRQRIYRLRHDVYARELAQHPVNTRETLRDALDDSNVYLVAQLAGELVGWISITPPDAPAWSLDKYMDRSELPFNCDHTVYEVRLLTVTRAHRHNRIAAALMYAALRWVESRGGRRIVAIGRREVLSIYRKVGLQPLGRTITSGAVTFELVAATTDAIHAQLDTYADRLNRLRDAVDWQLDVPFQRPCHCYHGGAFFQAVGDGFDDLTRADRIVNADVLDAWFPPPPSVIDAIQSHLPWLARTSPPTGCEGMIRAIADARHLPPPCILPGAGSSDLIFLALTRWVTAASRVLILDPMYGEYAHVLENVIGCRVDRLPLRRSEQFQLDPAMLRQRLQRGYDMAILVNPNSPTGRHVDRDVLLDVIDTAPKRTRIWIDETYIEYAGSSQSLERAATCRSNLVICKSMSKMYALSGLRAAYLVGPAAVIESLRPFQPPWAVSLPAQVAAVHALKEVDYYHAKWTQTHELRDELARNLTAQLPITITPGIANFILCHLPSNGPTAAQLVAACRADGVYLRDAQRMGRRLGQHALRIAVKPHPDQQRITQSLTTAFARLC